MFVRVKNTPNSPRQSVQIVESWREGGKVRQRIVRHVGIAADNQELEHLESLAELIKAKIEEQIQPALFSPEELARLIHQGRQCKQPSQDKVAISGLRGEQVVTLDHQCARHGQCRGDVALSWPVAGRRNVPHQQT